MGMGKMPWVGNGWVQLNHLHLWVWIKFLSPMHDSEKYDIFQKLSQIVL